MDRRRSEGIEVSARTVEEATAQALEQLGLRSEQVDVEIVKRGSRGLLGLLSEDAVVRVTPKTRSPIPDVQQVELADARSRQEEPEEQEAEEGTSDDEIASLGAEILRDLMKHVGIRAEVVRESPPVGSVMNADSVRLNIAGDELGVLIGRRGETLRDLQYLTCLLVSRKTQRWPNLDVDVEDYKARREKTLTELAHRMADRVRETGQSVPLEPMPANERRIVHLALRDDPDVFTESYGQDEKRKVVILPKA